MAPDAQGHVVVVRTAADDPRLGRCLDVLTEDLPPDEVRMFGVASGAVDPLPELVVGAAAAAYVVVQETAGAPNPAQIVAVVAARTAGVPLLLVGPKGPVTSLMTIGDIAPSRVLVHPASREDDAGWRAFEDGIVARKQVIADAVDRMRRAERIRPLTERLTNNADVLAVAGPDEAVAATIARVFDLHASSVRLENHVDYLQLDLPSNLYAELLRDLTRTFKPVRTIADPLYEELPWDDPANKQALTAVTERTYAFDIEYALGYGIEHVLTQLHIAVRAGGVVSVVGLDDDLPSPARSSAVNQGLRGLNRFYAGDRLVGGYIDDTGSTIRVLAFHQDAQNRQGYEREMDLLRRIDERKQFPPNDRAVDRTALASWLYTHVFNPKPRIAAIYDHDTEDYASDYDGNIVRVTPGYFQQLDALSVQVKRALSALYSPYSGQDRTAIRLLELGAGTGAMTGRLIRVADEFLAQVWNEREPEERSIIEFDGWDSNRRMIEILSRRITSQITPARSGTTRPTLAHRRFDPDGPGASTAEQGHYDLVVGSLFSHYWMDYYPNHAVKRAAELRRFRDFLTAVRDQLLGPGAIAMFLDVFYDGARRDAEQRAWSSHIERELGDRDAAENYLNRNPWQYNAASREQVTELAEDLGFRVWWRDAFVGTPFRIMTLAKP